MSTVVGAANAADAQAVEAVRSHHAQLPDALAAELEAFVDAASRVICAVPSPHPERKSGGVTPH
mgnify:CR=1 FL=1